MTAEQPRKSFKRIARITLMLLGGAVLFSLCAAGMYLGIKGHRISGFDFAFAKIRVGDGEAKVIETMGAPHEIRTTDQFFFPSAKSVEGDNGPGIKQLCYRVDTYFLPITWVTTIDSGGLVKNKFRLD